MGQGGNNKRNTATDCWALTSGREGLWRSFSIQRIRIDEFGKYESIFTFDLLTNFSLQNYPP